MRLLLWLLIYLPALVLALPAFAWSVAVWGITRAAPRLRRHTPRAVRPLIGFDQLLSAMSNGDPDETISSRLGKSRGRCVLCRVACWLLDRIDPDHCSRAVEPDRGARVEEQQ